MMWPQQIPLHAAKCLFDPSTSVPKVQESAATPPVRQAPDPLPVSPWASDLAGHWMQALVATVSPEQTLGELAELLSLHQISGAPVVDEEGRLLGVVSQSDMAHYLGGLQSDEVRPSSGFYQDRLGRFTPLDPAVRELLTRKTVAELFTPHVHSVSPDATLDDVIGLMLREHVHRLPVVLEGKLVGLISTFDVLRVVRDERSLRRQRRKLRRSSR